MKVFTFAPYGKVNQESGLIALFAAYLRSAGHSTATILCDGVFAACGRDAESGWKRSLDACFTCAREQSLLSNWTGSSVHPLSQEISSAEFFGEKRTLEKLGVRQFQEAKVADLSVWELCVDSLRDRLGAEVLHLADERVQATVRAVLLASAVMAKALDRLIQKNEPELLLIAGERDFLSRTAQAICRQGELPYVNFIWNVSKRCIEVKRSIDGTVCESPLVIDDIASFRNDPGTWSEDVISLLSELAGFLDLSTQQEFLRAAP